MKDNQICIWCGKHERVEYLQSGEPGYTALPIFQGGIFIHRTCNNEFMGTLIAMARREKKV